MVAVIVCNYWKGGVLIESFGNRETERLYHGEAVKAKSRLPREVRMAALRKMDVLNSATALLDIRAVQGNRLETLQGNLKGRHSIRINNQYRLAFRWSAGAAHDVEIVDYH